MRAAIYARYSSDNQREESIEDQARLCRRRIEAEGWTLSHKGQSFSAKKSNPRRRNRGHGDLLKYEVWLTKDGKGWVVHSRDWNDEVDEISP